MSRSPFGGLLDASSAELRRLMARGGAPAEAALLGWEFRGWNGSPLFSLVRARHFRKGFVAGGEAGAWGYNVLVRQDGSWAPATRPRLFFRLLHARDLREPAHPDALVIAYGGWPRHPLDPLRLLVDYVVQPDPTRPELLLGAAYLEARGRRVFGEHFLLERAQRARVPAGTLPSAAPRPSPRGGSGGGRYHSPSSRSRVSLTASSHSSFIAPSGRW